MSTSTRIWITGLCLSLALTLGLPITGSRAQVYVGVEGGWTSLPDRTDTIPGVTSAVAAFDNGFNAGARVGYEWGAWRFEEEYRYRQNGIHNLAGAGFTVNGVSGNRHTN